MNDSQVWTNEENTLLYRQMTKFIMLGQHRGNLSQSDGLPVSANYLQENLIFIEQAR